jgi:hypothetical protein
MLKQFQGMSVLPDKQLGTALRYGAQARWRICAAALGKNGWMLDIIGQQVSFAMQAIAHMRCCFGEKRMDAGHHWTTSFFRHAGDRACR